MKRIAALIIVGWPFSVCAHPCPYDWNIEFSQTTKIEGKTLADFAKQFNDAVRKQTNGKVKKAIVYEEKPDTFTKVPGKSPFSEQMDTLIRHYAEVTAPLITKGVSEYGGTPTSAEFPANFPVACLLAATLGREIGYDETKEGAMVTIHRELECRAYKLSDNFLKRVGEDEREGRVPQGCKPVPYTFARYSGMKWELNVFDEQKVMRAESIVNGVTLYLPDRKVIIAIETNRGHGELTKSMKERGYLEELNQTSSQAHQQGTQPTSPGQPATGPDSNPK
jgi:hypothetical protein